jgi:hypothetical protein
MSAEPSKAARSCWGADGEENKRIAAELRECPNSAVGSATGRRTHDYGRHGITSLFAAFNVADGSVIGGLCHRHRAAEFGKSSPPIDKTVLAGLDILLICDNHGTHTTPAINAWPTRRPRFHMQFTPTGSSWINQVELWFGYPTGRLIRRGVHKSVQAPTCWRPAWTPPSAPSVTHSTTPWWNRRSACTRPS